MVPSPGCDGAAAVRVTRVALQSGERHRLLFRLGGAGARAALGRVIADSGSAPRLSSGPSRPPPFSEAISGLTGPIPTSAELFCFSPPREGLAERRREMDKGVTEGPDYSIAYCHVKTVVDDLSAAIAGREGLGTYRQL